MRKRLRGFAVTSAIALVISIAVFFIFEREISARSDVERINRSVVKIFVISRKPSYYQPWQYDGQESSSGSGVIIEGGRILTNAHVVSDSVYIEVKRPGDPRKYPAQITAIGHQCDLAVLKTKDPAFFKGADPLVFADMPRAMDKITVHGYPEGGEDVSVTEGVVSRVEQVNYAHSGFNLLGAQVDAAINPGNSGGPAVRGNKIVGVAMQMLSTAQNIGYIIPTPVISHFLEDIADGKFDGFPEDGIFIQAMENETLRKYYGLNDGESGVLVTKVAYDSSAYGVIQPEDVLVAIDGVPVENDGSVAVGENFTVFGNYLTQRRFLGEKVVYDIVRQKKRLKVDATLKPPAQLVPYEQLTPQPRYFIYGGLVFMPLTVNYLMTWGATWWKDAPVELMHAYYSGEMTRDRQEMVILRNVLAHEVNAGYHDFSDRIVMKVNNSPVAGLADLVKKLSTQQGEYSIIEMDDGSRIVLDINAVAKTKSGLLKQYAIQSEASRDIVELSVAGGPREVDRDRK
ncbi:MAG: trypsin-like peptidase domain-containing protein [Nitrospinae bacterium]|nr:trypsin-like peptidase domain-containing protein [Nitrospinota bacterium]